jgi:hypothetical protein
VRDEKREKARERETARQTERESQPRDRETDRQYSLRQQRAERERGRAAIEGQQIDRQQIWRMGRGQRGSEARQQSFKIEPSHVKFDALLSTSKINKVKQND